MLQRTALDPLSGWLMKILINANHGRNGVSLLETVLAVAILATALAGLGHQTFAGLRASVRVELESRAALLCQSRIESLIPNLPASLPISGEPLPDAPEWRWSAELKPVKDIDEVQWLVVSVYQPGPQVELSRYSLSRLVFREVEGGSNRK
jgi:hypothetical protein